MLFTISVWISGAYQQIRPAACELSDGLADSMECGCTYVAGQSEAVSDQQGSSCSGSRALGCSGGHLEACRCGGTYQRLVASGRTLVQVSHFCHALHTGSSFRMQSHAQLSQDRCADHFGSEQFTERSAIVWYH